MSVAGKVNGKVLIKRVRQSSEGMIRDEQGGFRRGKGCVDQIFAVRQCVKSIWQMARKCFGHSWI